MKRAKCQKCLRPERTCICRWVTPTESPVEVVILQHPLEVTDAKGSARLLHLSLLSSRLVSGEVFDEVALAALLHAPFETRQGATADPGQAGRKAILLYPDTAEEKALGMQSPPLLDQMLLQDPARLRLIVLDGTWRKSRKMLYLNPLLQNLPRLPLRNPPASQYAIRKAHAPAQMSTLEASCYALMQLEGNNVKYELLLKAFGGFVTQQLEYAAGRVGQACGDEARTSSRQIKRTRLPPQ